MLRRIVGGLIGAALGYVVGAALGYFLVDCVSSNTHDRSVEAAMTGAFVVGPFVAIVASIFGFVRGGRKAPEADVEKP